MKKFLIICLAAFTLAACEKKDPLPQQDAAQLVELKHGTEHVKLQYAPNGKVSKAIVKDEDLTSGDEIEYLINYNAQGRISEVVSSEGETIRPVYTGGLLTKAEYLAANVVYGFADYTYQNDLVKKVEVKLIEDDEPFTTLKFDLTYNAQKQLLKSEVSIFNPLTQQLEAAGYTTLEYDNKKNPLYDIREFMLLLLDIPAAQNIAKETQFDEANVVDETREYTYTYNAKNVPTAAVQKTTSPGQPVVTTNLTYTYR
jgi:hypothetical protein